MFKPVYFTQQVVNGMMYDIKIQVTADEYIHVEIYQPIQGQAELQDIEMGLSLMDPVFGVPFVITEPEVENSAIILGSTIAAVSVFASFF